MAKPRLFSFAEEQQRAAHAAALTFKLCPPPKFVGHTIYGYWAADGTLLYAYERRT